MAVGGRGRQGPQAERETIYEAQRRHRRSGWRFSLLSMMAVGLLGLPLSVVVSPFITAVGLMGLDVVNLVVPMPDPGADIGHLIEELSDSEDQTSGAGSTVDGEVEVRAGEVGTVAVALVVPGMVLMGVTWRGVRRLFLRSGAGAVVLAAGARPPRPGDLEERQLVNLVEEMSLAAGVPPPRVMLLDSDLVNAAVVGTSIDDAVLIVPRRMLDDLGRGPTGALVADLLAVVVNGDLRIALVIASVFQTFDLIGAALAAPYSRSTRRVLWRLCRLALRRRPRPEHDGAAGLGVEAHFVARELAVVARMGADDASEEPKGGCVTTMLQLPFLVASMAFILTRLIVGGFFVAPIMAALWRRRRLLADATAVELTRDPDSLMAAFAYLEDHATTVPAGPWTHLFVVGPEVAHERLQRHFERRRDEIWSEERLPGESALSAVRRRTREALTASAEYQRATAPDGGELGARPAGGASGGAGLAGEVGAGAVRSMGGDQSLATSEDDGSDELASFLPKLGKRRARLAAMGAQLEGDPGSPRGAGGPPSLPQWSLPVRLAGWVVGLALLGVILVLFLMILALLGALIYLALLFELALLAPPVAIVHALLR